MTERGSVPKAVSVFKLVGCRLTIILHIKCKGTEIIILADLQPYILNMQFMPIQEMDAKSL